MANKTPIGWLDTIINGIAAGWALDPDTPSKSISVHFYVDGPAGLGTLAGGISAGLARPDVNAGTGYPGNHGFSFSIPSQFRDGKLHTLFVHGIDSSGTPGANILLSGVPQTFLLTASAPPPPPSPVIPSSLITTFVGTAITRPGLYDYGPTIFYDGAIYHLYWCSLQEDGTGDAIMHATSKDGLVWINVQRVLTPTPFSEETAGQADGHVCDPSVVKVGGTYYLYYTAASLSGQNNQIFLSRSSDGVLWTKYPNNASPQPVIRNTAQSGQYGIGQSVVFYKDGKFWHYYTDTDKAGEMLALASDGISFTVQNEGKPVFAVTNYIPTFLVSYGIFFAISTQNELTNKGLYYSFSFDGIKWDPLVFDEKKKRAVGGNRGSLHNAGILGDSNQLVSGSVVRVFYGAGDQAPLDGLADATWDIDMTDIALSQNPSPAPAPQNKTPVGFLDGVAFGWAYDPDDSSVSISVHFYVDGPAGSGVFAGAVTANLSRPDVNSAYGIAGNHGFSFSIPSQFRDGKQHTLYAHGIDTSGIGTANVLLSGVPQTFVL